MASVEVRPALEGAMDVGFQELVFLLGLQYRVQGVIGIHMPLVVEPVVLPVVLDGSAGNEVR